MLSAVFKQNRLFSFVIADWWHFENRTCTVSITSRPANPIHNLDINGANYKVSTFLSSIHLQFQSISTNNVINNKVGRIIIIIYIVYGLSHFTNKQIWAMCTIDIYFCKLRFVFIYSCHNRIISPPFKASLSNTVFISSTAIPKYLTSMHAYHQESILTDITACRSVRHSNDINNTHVQSNRRLGTWCSVFVFVDRIFGRFRRRSLF